MTRFETTKLFAPALLLIILLSVFAPKAMAQANVTGQWQTLSNQMPINPVHVALMHNGKVLVVSGSGNVANNTNFQAGVFDPATGTVTTQPVAWDMFCNGMVVLPDGRVIVNGGTVHYDPFHGQPKTSIYDPATGQFVDVQNMAHGRWYPTVTSLSDGSVMTFSGLDEVGNTNTAVEIYTVGSGWSQQFNAGWTPPLYPRMHLLPNGTVFYSGSTQRSSIFDPSTHTWAINVAITNYSGTRTYGSSVLLPLTPGNAYKPKVMILGGGNPATATTELIDLSAANPSWVYGPSMSQPRIEMNATILPNGKVLALGGSLNDEDTSTASLKADLYDPNANTMSSAGANAFPRLYHSVALLLPDATVWSAGGNPQRGSYEPHMEIYSPPYLFNPDGSLATRPTITSLSSSVIGYGSAFQVQTPDAASIAGGSVVLVRPGSFTHASDMDQRLVGLSFTVGSGVLNVTAPPNGNIAPPGYYMLFLLNSAGVPSVAKFLQVNANPTDQPPTASITTPTTDVTILEGQAVSFSGTGTDPDGTITSYSWAFPGGSPSSSMLANPGNVIYSTLGNYTASLTVTDNAGLASLSPATRAITVQPMFSLSASPTSQTLAPGGGKSYTVTLTPGTGFSGTVTFSVSGLPAGATATFNPTSLSASGSTTLTISTTSATPAGNYPLTITGTSAGVQHSTTVTLTVSASGGGTGKTISIDFVGSGTAMGSSETAGVVAKANWNNASGPSSASALALVDETGSANTATVTWKSDDNWALPITDVAGNVRMMRGYLDTGSANTTTVTVSGLPSNANGYNVYVYADGDNPNASRTGIYQISGTGITTTSISLTDAAGVNFSGTFTQANNSNGNYVVFTINASGFTLSAIPSTSTDAHPRAPVNGIQIVPIASSLPDFTLSASPSSATVTQGNNATYTVSAAALNGFSGSVSLSVSGLPTGATATFNPTAISGSATSTLTISTASSTPAGSATLTITGTSGSLSHTTTVALNVTGAPDFSVSATPSSATVNAGSSTTYTVSAPAVNGFSGSVNLNVSGLPASATASFNPASISGSTTSTLTVSTTSSTPAGNATLTITGSSGSLSHTTTVGLVVNAPPTPDFSVSASPSSQTVIAGGSTSYTSMVTAVGGFSGTVTLSVSGLPTGATASFNPSSVVGSGTSTLSVSTLASTSPGIYTLTLTGTSGSLTHSTTVSFAVSGVPAGWTDLDIGSPAIAGSATYNTGVFTVNSGGADIWGSSDQFHYVFQSLTGDLTITARVASQQNTNSWAKSGVMIRETTTANSSNVFVMVTPANGVNMQYRPTTGGSAVQLGQVAGLVAPYWVRLVRSGGTFTGYSSADGTTWAQVGSISVAMASSATAGLAVTAHNNSVSNTSTFDSISMTTPAPDFSLTATPSSQTVFVGGSTSYTTTVTALNGFSGTVTLSVSGLPAGATANFNPGSLVGSGTSTLTVTTSSATPFGTSTLIVAGTSGSLTHTASVTLTVPPPSITSLNPTSGPVGTSVTITGTSFGVSQGTSTVTFNGTVATPTTWSDTSIVAPVPSGATRGNVVVTVKGVASNGVSFNVLGVPGWTELLNTKITPNCPIDTSGTITETVGCPAVTIAWSGAAADTTNNRLIIWGGGHQNYAGNEVYALNLSAKPPTMTRLTNPSQPFSGAGCLTGGGTTQADGQPTSRETYGGLAFMPNVGTAGKMYAYSGSKANCGYATPDTWSFDLSTFTWTRQDPTSGGPPQLCFGCVADYDPNTGLVFNLVANGSSLLQLWAYDPVANAYSCKSITTGCDAANGYAWNDDKSGVIDYGRKFFFALGGRLVNGHPAFIKVDLSGNDPNYRFQDISATHLNSTDSCYNLITAYAPGLTYDPVTKNLVGWFGGNSVVTYNPDTDSCTTLTYPGGPPSPPRLNPYGVAYPPGSQQTNGTYGRFRYFPALGVFIVVNDNDLDAWMLQL